MPIYEYGGKFYDLSETDPAAAKAKILAHLGAGGQKPATPQQPATPEERGITGYLGDLGAAFGAGAGQAVAFPGQLYRLATGETEPGFVEGLGRRATEYWEAKKSETQRAKERAVERKVNAAEEAGAGVLGQAGVAFGEVITDPALLSTYIAQSLPQVVGGGIVGGAVKGGTKLAARKLAAEASKESIEKAATKAGVSAAVATAALMQGTDVGADTFDEAVAILKKQGYSEEDAKVQAIELGRKAATNATLASLATQMLPGGRTIESALVRGGLGKGAISGAVKGALGEMPSEGLEEGSGAFFKNLALSEIDPTRKLSQDVGLQMGTGAAAGAGQGAIFGGISGRGEKTALEPKPEVPPKPKAEPKAKGKRSAEEAAIDALDQETIEERKIEDVNKELTEVALEDQQQPPLGGTADLEGVGQPEVGRAGVGVSVPQPPAETPAAADVGAGRLATAEGPTVTPAAGTGQPSAPLADEQINNLIDAGFTASQIESGVELVGRLRSRGGLQDVLLTPVARDHAAGLTSEEIAKKNKIDAPLVSAIQVGLGLVPNEKAKPAAVETPAAEGPAIETAAGEVEPVGALTPKATTEIAETDKQAWALAEFNKVIGSTREAAASYSLTNLRSDLTALEKNPFPNREDQNQSVAELKAKIESIEVALPTLKRMDETDSNKSLNKFLLGDAKQNLDAAVKDGRLTEAQADDLIDTARATGNAFDASDVIDSAVAQTPPAPIAETPATDPIGFARSQALTSFDRRNSSDYSSPEEAIDFGLDNLNDTLTDYRVTDPFIREQAVEAYRNEIARLKKEAAPAVGRESQPVSALEQRFDFITKSAEKDNLSWPVKDRALFHKLNPNGIVAAKRAMDEQVTRLVNEGLAASGAILAYGSFNNFNVEGLYEDKRITRKSLAARIERIQNDIDTARKFVEETRKAATQPAAPAVETPVAETPASTALITISKREPVEAPKGVLRSKYTFSDGSAYQIEKRKDEFHLVGVPDENESYLGETRGEAERALNDDKNSGRLDQVVSKGTSGALQLKQGRPELQSVEPSPSLGGVSEETAQRTPSLKRIVDRLRKLWQAGKITGDEFAGQVNIAANSIENIKIGKPLKKRVRGADYIRERLLKAKREGALSSEAVALSEWFISQNEALVDDLAISIEQPPKRGESDASGDYNSFMRLMRLIKGAASDTTAIHEILHHLERMMPENIRSGIRREHARQTYNAYKKAKADGNAELVKFFEHVLDFNFGDPTGIGGVESSLSAAIKLIKDGAVPYSFYQYVNPSEFWAVNGTRIVEGKYAAIRGTTLTRLRNWLRNLAQKIKSAFGFSSDAPILRALDSLSKADGKFVTENMLFEETGAPPGRGILQSQEQDSIDVDGETRPLLNSRGQRIHPTDEGVRNFWRGFGDSKVVDEEGRPFVMYTGTSKDKDFSSFSVPKNGAWFTADSKEASQYAVENDSMNLVYTEGKYRPVNTASRVIPAYLSIRNPYKMTKTDFDEINKVGYKRAQGQFFDMLRFRGYDGVDMGGGIWVVLKSPTQVKSAVGNTGAFSPTEKKMLAAQEQEPTVLGLHPRVSQALRAGDFNGVFQAIRDTTSGFYAEIARRLVELNLPTAISTGAARARQLTRASIDLVSAPQQNRLFSYVQLTYPDLYNKYFQNYDAEANLERVYEGLKALKKVLPEASPVSAEFKDVLQAYSESIESIDPRTLGFYSPDFDEINIDIDRKGGTSNYVLLHEGVHAATEALITRYETEPETLTAEQRAAAKKLQELFEYTKSVFPGDPNTYGLRNIYEFVAEAFTNRGFQTELKKLEYDFAKPTSVWSRFVSTILKLFGAETVAANVMIEANKLFSASRPRVRPALGPMFAKQQKGGPATGGWRTAYDHNTTLIRLFQDAIKGRVPLDTVLKKAAPAVWNTSNYTARQIFLYMAPLRELAISTKSKFPQLTGAIKLVEQMVAYRGQKMKRAEEIVKDWSKLQSERFQQSALLGRIMLSATLQGQDPDTGNGSAALLQAWNALSPEAQSIYRRVRDFYASSIKEMITEMKDRAKANLANDPAALKKALSDIDALFKGIKGPYFPLRRFGDYWFQVGTTDKDKEFYTFESMTDREFAMNERMEELQNGTPAQKKLAETLKLGNSIGEVFDQNRDPTGVLGRVEDLIDSISATTAADVKKELKDSVHQLMYVLLPQQSMKKMFINRKGIQGASADMLRVFSDSAVHSAYQQARFRYSQDFLNNLTNAKDYIGEAQKSGLITPRQRAVYDEFIAEVGTRSGVILSTEDKRLSARAAAAANQTTFFWMLTAPATAMLNVIGAAVFGISDMGSKYGYAKTAALLTKNMAKYGASVPTRTIKPLMGKQFLAIDFPSMVEGGSLSPLQSMFAKAFIDAGDINISLTNALFEFGEQPSALYTGRMNTIKKFAAGLFHQAERFNREMVLMTSAELAYNKLLNEPIKDANGIIQRDASGKPLMRTQDATGFSQQAFDDALADARNVAGTALGDFSRAMKSRAMQSPVGSVLFSMKSFAITATFFLMRNVDLSLNRPFRSDELADMRAALLKQNIAPDVVDQRIREAQAELKASYSEARKRMAGVMGITFLFGGLQAQPFFSLALPALVAALKPDDEEEDELFNAENWFRNYMEVNLGGYLGEMAMKLGVEEKTAKKVGREIGEAVSGGIPAAAGVSLTDRVSIDLKDLWYRSPRYSPEYRETVMETIIANAGPAAGLVMNMVDATQLMEQGRYQRAFERALPAIVSNPLKAVRLGKEGAVTKSGATQVEEFTATELAMQALGFQPEILAQKQKSAMEAKTVEMQIKAKRNSVLDRLYLERDSEKGYEYALQMMDEYNKKYPYYAIKPKDISDSFKRKAKASAEAYGIGIAIPKKMRGRLEPMIEYARDEDEN